MNYGLWGFVQPRINNVNYFTNLTHSFKTYLTYNYYIQLLRKHKILKSEDKIEYIGRNPSSAPATGLYKVHVDELNEFMNQAFHI